MPDLTGRRVLLVLATSTGGVGRHVLGSNYFYYVQDPWGSFAEYSYDIDFVPADRIVELPSGASRASRPSANWSRSTSTPATSRGRCRSGSTRI